MDSSKNFVNSSLSNSSNYAAQKQHHILDNICMREYKPPVEDTTTKAATNSDHALTQSTDIAIAQENRNNTSMNLDTNLEPNHIALSMISTLESKNVKPYMESGVHYIFNHDACDEAVYKNVAYMNRAKDVERLSEVLETFQIITVEEITKIMEETTAPARQLQDVDLTAPNMDSSKNSVNSSQLNSSRNAAPQWQPHKLDNLCMREYKPPVEDTTVNQTKSTDPIIRKIEKDADSKSSIGSNTAPQRQPHKLDNICMREYKPPAEDTLYTAAPPEKPASGNSGTVSPQKQSHFLHGVSTKEYKPPTEDTLYTAASANSGHDQTQDYFSSGSKRSAYSDVASTSSTNDKDKYVTAKKKTKTEPGVCYIFINDHFEEKLKKTNISESSKIVNRLEKVFGIFGLTPKIYMNNTVKQIHGVVKEMQSADFSQHKYIITIIVSHGDILEAVYAKDDQYYIEDHMVQPLLHNETLKDKPKIFIIQADKGSAKLQADSAGPPSEILKLYSTYEGYISEGKKFIETLCDHLERDGRTTDLRDIMRNILKELKTYRDAKDGSLPVPCQLGNLTKPFILGNYNN